MHSADGLRATQAAYDQVAADYARLLPDMSVEAPLDLTVLAAFVELVEAAGGGTVLEVGCGTGRVMRHLAGAGVRIAGIDLSLGMARTAKELRTDLGVAVAHASALPVRSGALGGLLAWYSLIHLPTTALRAVATELARTLRPGAPVLLAFQAGEGERVDRAAAYGHDVPLTSYRHRTTDVADALLSAGLELHTTMDRAPTQAHESTPQGFVLARRPGP